MGERVQATYPRPGNLFYSFKILFVKEEFNICTVRAVCHVN